MHVCAALVGQLNYRFHALRERDYHLRRLVARLRLPTTPLLLRQQRVARIRDPRKLSQNSRMELIMSSLRNLVFALCLFSAGPLSAQVMAQPGMQIPQSKAEATVMSSTSVLQQVAAGPRRSIPQSLLEKAEGVAIIPGVIKIGLIGGVRRGHGVVLIRDAEHGWQRPIFVTLTGGSVGWQAGVQSTDVVLVFKSRRSLNGLMNGKFTIGADAAAAAGPIGRQAQAATDAQLQAEIYSYSRSRGLFAGVSLDGSVLQIDHAANNTYYQNQGEMPASATQLIAQLTALTPAGMAPGQVAPADGPANWQAANLQPAPVAAPGTKAQLDAASRQLHGLLDRQWQTFLALPAEVYTQGGQPTAEALEASLARYDRIASDPKYQAITARGEFQQTYALLKAYASERKSGPGTTLPPPPGQ